MTLTRRSSRLPPVRGAYGRITSNSTQSVKGAPLVPGCSHSGGLPVPTFSAGLVSCLPASRRQPSGQPRGLARAWSVPRATASLSEGLERPVVYARGLPVVSLVPHLGQRVISSPSHDHLSTRKPPTFTTVVCKLLPQLGHGVRIQLSCHDARPPACTVGCTWPASLGPFSPGKSPQMLQPRLRGVRIRPLLGARVSPTFHV